MSKIRSIPTRADIHRFWLNDSRIGPLLDSGINAGMQCYACLRMTGTQRCHILAVVDGGTDDSVENVHLLCPGCHAESEHLNGSHYWIWLNAIHSQAELLNTLHIQRQLAIAEYCTKSGDYPDWLSSRMMRQVLRGNDG